MENGGAGSGVADARELTTRRKSTTSTTAAAAWLIAQVFVAAAFAFRAGVPGFRQDWLWPATRSGFAQWFVNEALSQWNPHGLGGVGAIPTFNLVFASFAALGSVGLSPAQVLFLLLGGAFVAATFGILRLLRELDIHITTSNEFALATCYALGPICFQKIVAGHLFWLVAYSALPWFTAYCWRGFRYCEFRAFCIAALLFALSSTQVQFLAFDTFVLFVVAVAHRTPLAAWAGACFIVAIGLVHNANLFLAPFRASAHFDIAQFHATVAWERDMSGSLLDLARLSGYQGYDIASLPSYVRGVYAAAKLLVILLALLGVALRHDKRSITFGVIALAALFLAAGWNGPLIALLQWALLHTLAFTVFRELFHVMALYALAVVVLAALALERIPARAGASFPLLALVIAAPFFSLGLNHMIPVVRLDVQERRAQTHAQRLQVLLPTQEPVSEPGLPFGGRDPANLVNSVASAGDPPNIMLAVLDPRLTRATQLTLLGDMGIADIAWRPDRVSKLPFTFEPNVGAGFAGFLRREKMLRARYTVPVTIAKPRTILSLEPLDANDALGGFLADDKVPSGRDVPFTSSFEGNDIRKRWVSNRLWAWLDPDAERVLGEPVFTESNAALPLKVDSGSGTFVYILAAGRSPTLQNRPGSLCGPWRSGIYHWLRWRLNRLAGVLTFRSRGFSSVARVIVSQSPDWSPQTPPSSHHLPSISLPLVNPGTWSLTTTLPPTHRPMRLIYARSFAAGWTLAVNGSHDEASQRADGIFNGWVVAPAHYVRTVRISYQPQQWSILPVALDAFVQLALLLFLAFTRVPKASP